MICSMNAIDSLNARYRRAVRTRRHFPTEQAAMKCLYLVTRAAWTHQGRPYTMDDALEARAERPRHHFSDRFPRLLWPSCWLRHIS
jgi:transposase-like protein